MTPNSFELDQAKAKTRVLIAAPSLEILGGQSRQAALLLEWLNRESDWCASFVPHNPRLPGVLRLLQRIKYVRTVVTSLWYWALLLIRVRQCDLVHVFSASYYSYLLSVAPALFIARLYGKKSVLNYHSGEADDHLTNWKLTAVPTMKWASAIVVQTGYLQSVFAKFGLTARVIHSSINLSKFTFRQRKPLQPVFLSNRLHEPLYNVGCILRAFDLIQRRFPEARLIVAGDGTERANLEALAATLELKGVEFIGKVEFSDMPRLYDSANIYLNATNLDNLPSSILESYAAGLPVVTTNAGGIPYILRHEETGFLVELNDHKAMAEHCIRLLEDAELADRIVNQALRECPKYTFEIEREAWLGQYQKLIDRKLLSDDAQRSLTAAER